MLDEADEPVSAGLRVDDPASASSGLYWVITRPDSRGQGLGRLVVTTLLAGAPATVRQAVLQATDAGQRLYESLGFTTTPRWLRLRYRV